MISKLDRWCNWDNKNRPAIATRINSLSSLLLEDIGSPTKQWFADNLRHLPLSPVTPSPKVESSAYPGALLSVSCSDLVSRSRCRRYTVQEGTFISMRYILERVRSSSRRQLNAPFRR